MKSLAAFTLVLCLWMAGHGPGSFLWGGQDNKQADSPKKPRPKFTIGKETTYITEPVDEDGYIDYASALNKILSKGVTPDNNANVLLWQAFGPHPEGATMSPEFYKWLGIAAPPEKGDYFVDLLRYLQAQGQFDPTKDNKKLMDEHDHVAERPWQAGQYPHIAQWLKAQEKPLAVVVQATQRTQYLSPIVVPKTKHGPGGMIGALLPAVQKCRQAAHALAARAMWHLGEGRTKEAWQDLLATHRLGTLVARGSTMIEGLVGIAIDNVACEGDLVFLANAKLDVQQIKACLADLQKLPPMSDMAEKVNLGERFMCLDSLMLIDRGGPDALLGTKSKPQPLTGKINWDPALRNVNGWYDKMYLAMKIKERAARVKKLALLVKEVNESVISAKKVSFLQKLIMTSEARGKLIGDIAIGLLLPALHKVQEAWDRIEQTQHNLQLAFALAAYRSEQGQFPQKLDALAPKHLPAIPQDIFSGKALIYRPAADGYLLYSVGANGIDDRGHWHGDDPPGDDLRVQMPLPPQQRKE